MSLLLFTFPFQHFGLGSKRLGQGGHLLGDQGISRPLGNQLGLRRLLFQSLGGLAHLHLTAGRLGCSTGTTPRLRLGSECREGTPVYAWARNSDHQNWESGSARSDSVVQELLHRGWHFVVLRKAPA